MSESATTNDSQIGAIGLELLEFLPDRIVLIDSERKVLFTNKPARDIFPETAIGRDLALVLRHPGTLDAVTAVLADGPEVRVEIELPVPVPRSFEAHVAALPPGNVTGAAAILVLRDLTRVKSAEQMRVDFVSNVSHELRSPLSSLIGFIETLREAARDDASARERFLDIMDREARRMTRLVEDLLSLSHVEINEHVPPSDRVDVGQILEEVAKVLLQQAEDRGVAIELRHPDHLPEVLGDRDEITQVVHNLLDNGVKYGAPDSAVRVIAEQVEHIPDVGGSGIAVAFEDSGEGIAPQDIPRLTERFYRIDKSRSRELGGTGLGLAIVKHIMNRHRGRLKIESTVGQGTRFTVYFPLAEGAEDVTPTS